MAVDEKVQRGKIRKEGRKRQWRKDCEEGEGEGEQIGMGRGEGLKKEQEEEGQLESEKEEGKKEVT